MRVAVFRHRLAPGVEPFIERQVRGLGPDVRVFTAASSTLPGVDLWSLEQESGFSTLAMRIFQSSRRSGLLERAIKRYAPDVLLAHFAQDAWRIERIARRSGVPLIAIIHGSDALASDAAAGALGLSGRQLRRHWPDLAASAALFLPVSDYVEQRLIDRGVPHSKIIRHYLGVSVPAVLQDREPAYDIGFVGRLEPNKGALRLLEEIQQNIETFAFLGREVRVLVVGDGTERLDIERLAGSALGLHVDVVGQVPPDRVEDHVADCALIVCCSIELASGIGEGLGLVSLEAQACGRPVVVFETGGLAETVREGRTGLVVESGDWSKLTVAISGLLEDPGRRKEMGREARRWVERNWDVEQRNADLVVLLEALFGPDGSGALPGS